MKFRRCTARVDLGVILQTFEMLLPKGSPIMGVKKQSWKRATSSTTKFFYNKAKLSSNNVHNSVCNSGTLNNDF